MANRDNIYDVLGIVDGIEDSVIADTDPPEVGCSLKFSTPFGSRTACQSFYLPEDAGDPSLPKAL